MYTEIIKIIEGGLLGDKEKVLNYAVVLADNLENQGDLPLAKKIRSVLSNKKGKMTALDSFSTKPVDAESRMDIVEISYPRVATKQIVLSKYTEQEICGFIECYMKRESLLKAGLEPSNSLLLYGPPGCGKTTTAQYISSVTGLPLVTARLEGLISSLLGSTAKNIRKIFDYAAKRECILLLDEFDVIAKLRDDKNELGELKRVVNSLIQNIDGLNSDSILIAATNHDELLDSAIWRRFSKVIALEKPQKGEIGKLLYLYLSGVANNILSTEKKAEQMGAAFVGFSHSDIKTVINNSVRQNIIRGKESVTSCDILREIYFHKHHRIKDEDEFIRYLFRNNATHKEINESLGIPLRKIQGISKSESKGGS
ncbi:ATPase, AAA-type, core [Acididesulfobacillus acetoxydans]|uniref:ATPase n=1 Tax=Acididesulfobacillus acetoxydans TaxID=1561005 RepID=A0A8S0XUM4_9FIRM|nr:AAA family ATPase [Acididesulfobacillus acetoxydans]CAA7599577.1 ATPase, AAA-type, core [Acididesulfobacillus acetoxydans]CEJ07772.1 ATPase [Acididesulfobacillus acetoxydans]